MSNHHTGAIGKQACERRVFRLATLLTGDPEAATRVLDAVIRAQPDLRRLDSAHLDRLTILRAREHTALTGLRPQQREAWILLRVYGLPEREAARAMDCSVTATRRHLELAEKAIDDPTGAELRRLVDLTANLDVPEDWRARREARAERRRLLTLAGILLLVLAAMWVLSKVMV